ncbi:unnamed protein product [Angiostrongylus costaricensis]|uniref:glutamine synthetase n=1 Tax=Angiostrongylus costaricensis TaxID=334426 RepID=A0A0R3P9U5_ANGCS|nr:unnamed protein product [Angiostrongylus costaricensis]
MWRTLSSVLKRDSHKNVPDYPYWGFDGSSTYQADKGEDSDMILKPVALYADPFFGGPHKLVLCEVLDANSKPSKTNHRHACKGAMDKILDKKPLFGMEQEYLLLTRDGYPLGWPKYGYPAPQGPYYCSIGADRAFGREVVNTHYRAALHAGLTLFGINCEVTPGQWEFQLGQCEGLDMGDQLWMARYLLHRVAEQFGVAVTFHPKPRVTMGDWNGAGCHCNFSTEEMRAEGGIKAIEADDDKDVLKAMKKLEATHKEAIRVYDPHDGEDNKLRVAPSMYILELWSLNRELFLIYTNTFQCRSKGFHLFPSKLKSNFQGYLEDRRPSSNCDPYQVTRMIVESILLR